MASQGHHPSHAHTKTDRLLRRPSLRAKDPKGKNSQVEKRVDIETQPSKKQKRTEDDESPPRTYANIAAQSPVKVSQGVPVILSNIPQELLSNPIQLGNIIRELCPEAKVSGQKCNKNTNSIVLFPVDSESSSLLQDADLSQTVLKDCKVSVASQTNTTKKQTYAVLLTGVDPDIPEGDVGHELIRQGIHVEQVVRLKDRNTRNPTYKLKVVLLDFHNQQKLLQSGAVYLGYSRHRVMEFLESPEVLVCFNCQAFGHKAVDCRNKPACVRCGEEHKVSECTWDKTMAQCCRCGGAHSAAYRGCESYKKQQQLLIEKRKKELSSHPKTPIFNSNPTAEPIQSQHPDTSPVDNAPTIASVFPSIIIDVLFSTLNQYCPIPIHLHAPLLSDLCKFTSESVQQLACLTVDAQILFVNAKTRLKANGRLPDKT